MARKQEKPAGRWLAGRRASSNERGAVLSRFGLAVALGGALMLVTAAIDAGRGGDAAGAQPDDKVTICHRTDSVKNPYLKITVAVSSVNGNSEDDKGQGDHALEHRGPVVSSQDEAQDLKDAKREWGDIIPPSEGVPGYNWTAEGREVYGNDCGYPEPTATPTEPPATPTEPPVTPTEPPATPTEPPATPTQPPATPTQPPATPTEPTATAGIAEVAPVQATAPPTAVAGVSDLPSAGSGGDADSGGGPARLLAGVGLLLAGIGLVTLSRKLA